MEIGTVYSQEELKIGQFRYAAQLMENLERLLGDELKKHPLKKKEYQIFGKPIGGYFSLWIQKLFTNYKEDIVHALDPACAPSNIDVVTIHDLIPFKFPEIYMSTLHDKIGHLFNRWIAKKIPYFIVQTQHVKNDLIKMWDIEPSRIFITPPGLSHEIFRPSKKIPDCMKTEKNTILFVGDDNPRKNLPLVMKSMIFLEDVRLIWVGGSKWEKVQKECNEIIKKNDLDVIRPGFVPDEELKDYYSNVDLFVYPSKDEGTGYTPIEAMACGTTSVVSDIPVFHEVLGDMVYYSKQEPEILADTIRNAFENKFDENELLDYSNKFQWETTAKSTVKVYEEILEKS